MVQDGRRERESKKLHGVPGPRTYKEQPKGTGTGVETFDREVSRQELMYQTHVSGKDGPRTDYAPSRDGTRYG